MKKLLGFIVAMLAVLTITAANPASANTQVVWDCTAGNENWTSWEANPSNTVAGQYCPGNGDVTVTGRWAAWDKSSDGLCAEIWVSPSATGAFQRVPGTKACGYGIVARSAYDGSPLSYSARARVVRVYNTYNGGWADSGYEIFNQYA